MQLQAKQIRTQAHMGMFFVCLGVCVLAFTRVHIAKAALKEICKTITKTKGFA